MSLPHHGQSEITVTPFASSAATSVQLTLVSLRSTMPPPPETRVVEQGLNVGEIRVSVEAEHLPGL